MDLDSPGRRDYWVALEHDSIWGDHLIPLSVFVGPQAMPGHGLVAFGSNHGKEYEGPVIKHLLREINAADVLGRIILIPVLNPAAFLAGTRESTLDDGVNLNRAFVDQAGVNPALSGSRVCVIMDHITRQSDKPQQGLAWLAGRWPIQTVRQA